MPRLPLKRDRRRHARKAVTKIVPVLCEDDEGHETLLQGQLLDASVAGVKMLLPTKLPSRALVTFNCLALGLSGRGTVRYCNAAKGGYEVGLEISTGTGWRDQNADLQNLAAGLAPAESAPPKNAEGSGTPAARIRQVLKPR